MVKLDHPVEKLIQTITFKGVEFDVVERPDVLWVGCVNYANNNTNESDINTTLNRYREELIEIVKQDLINPDWSASLSINYGYNDKPKGVMFAQETYSDKQDKRYDLFKQSGGLWLRVLHDKSIEALLDRESDEQRNYFGSRDLFALLRNVASENGYRPNPDVHVEVEYSCHTEYNTSPSRNYAYIPIIKLV